MNKSHEERVARVFELILLNYVIGKRGTKRVKQT